MSKLDAWMVEAEFDAKKGYTCYSNATLEFMINCDTAPAKERVYCLILRQSWGWDSPFAVKWRDRTGKHEAFGQVDIAERLSMTKTRVSRLCAELEQEGRLLAGKGRMLYPSGRPVPPAAVVPAEPEEPKLPNLATLKKIVLRFIPKFPVAELANNGNFEKAWFAVSEYKRRQADAKTGYQNERKVAEECLVEGLCLLVDWQPSPKHPYITTSTTTKPLTTKPETTTAVPPSPGPVSISEPPTGRQASSVEPACLWHGTLRTILAKASPPDVLGDSMFGRIAAHLTEGLLPQFKAAVQSATGIRKWSGIEAIAKQVAARGLVAAGNGSGDESLMERAMRIRGISNG